MAMKQLLIVWHSRTGTAKALAMAAAQAARQQDTLSVRIVGADAAMVGDLLQADGYIFVGPENLAGLSGEMKAFFDRTYYGALEQLNGRPYAHLIAAGSDGSGAARQLARIVSGWRLKPVSEPTILVTGAQTPEAILAPKLPAATDLAPARELGAAMAAGLVMGVF